jgi:hypothetical protein
MRVENDNLDAGFPPRQYTDNLTFEEFKYLLDLHRLYVTSEGIHSKNYIEHLK